MTITQWPEAERPREKLLQRGVAALSDAELLAIFLRTGVPGMTAVDLARHLLEEFGGLRALLGAEQRHFCASKGLGKAKFAQLQAVMEMARRCLGEQIRSGDALSSPQAVREYLSHCLTDRHREQFGCLYLDSQHRVLNYRTLFFGTIDSASVYPREVLQSCLKQGAAAVIFAHNHPSGIAEPSQADRQITQRLVDALALVDIRVLDHLVIGHGDVVSFAERGLI